MAQGLRDWPNLYVVARLLECLWRQPEPMLKTRLQVAANVNYDVFSRYLEWMQDRGLVFAESVAGGHERIGLTPSGREAYRRLVQWINEMVHQRMPGD